MGRFLNPKALKTVRTEPVSPPYRTPQISKVSSPVGTSAALEVLPSHSLPEQPRSLWGMVGLVSLVFYMIAPELNDLFAHIGVKIYVSAVSSILLALAFLASGSATRGLKLPMGKYWVLFTCILVATVPFSTWPSASLGQLESYIPRGILCYFAITAFVADVAAVKWFFFAVVTQGFLLLLNCLVWGGPTDDGRFVLEGSSFYANSNELALALMAGIPFFVYLIFQKGAFKLLVGAVGFLADIYFLLKTGSRGGFIAFAAVIVVSLIFSAGHRAKILSMMLLLPLLIVFVPAETLQRLTYIFADPATATVQSNSDTAAVLSQIQRTQLFWRSVHMTGEHPLLGVGVGEFPDAVYQDDVANHTRSAALGTHNSYTQVSSECGIPALLVYLLIIVTGIRMNYRIYKRTLPEERLSFFPTAALCVLTASVGFAVGSAFHHVAWSGVIPSLTGVTAGLWLACQKEAEKAGLPNLLANLDG